MRYEVRPFRPADAEAVAALFHASIRQTGAGHYSAAQLRAWSSGPPDPDRFVGRAADGRSALVVADENGRAVAYGDLERDGHLDLLYCHPDHGRRGLASRLCEALEAQAKTWGVPSVFVEASAVARPLFERRGYVLEARRDFERKGVAIHNYRMARVL